MFRKAINKYKILPIQVRASLWFLVCSFLQKGISTLTTPVFTRLLDTAEYGQYIAFSSWLEILTIFVCLQLSAGVYQQALIKFENERDILSSSLQGLTLTLCCAWTVIYAAFHHFWNALFSLTTAQMLAMLLMIWTTAVFNFWAAEQRVKLTYQRLVLLTIAVSLAKPILGILLVTHTEAQYKVTVRVLGIALVELIAYFGLFVIQMKRGKQFFHARFWKYALLFNLPLIPHYLSQTVLSSADRIMIRDMVGESEAGIYGLAYSLSMIMVLFNTALSQTLGPWMYQKIKVRREGDIARVAYGGLLLVAAVNLLLIAVAPEAVAIFAPKDYHNAIWVIPPVAMSVYFMFAYDLFAKFEFYYEKTRFIMAASIAAAALNLLLNYIFIRIFGYYAAGYTTLFCYMIYTAGHYVFMRKVCRTHMAGAKVYDLRILLGITMGFLMLGFVLLFTYNYSYVRYAFLGAALLAILINAKRLLRLAKALLEKRNAAGKQQ